MEQMYSRNSDRSLHIIGIIHRDARNSRCIKQYLDGIRPDTVTLEFSHYGLQFRKKYSDGYIQRLESVKRCMHKEGVAVNADSLLQLRAYMNVPSEYDAAHAYCAATGARLYLIDMDRYSRINLKVSDELFSEENIRKVAATPVNNSHRTERVMAELFFKSDVKTITYSNEMSVRDRYMSRRIQVLFNKNHCRHIAHITGWRHLEDPQGIFAPLRPIKLFAYD